MFDDAQRVPLTTGRPNRGLITSAKELAILPAFDFAPFIAAMENNQCYSSRTTGALKSEVTLTINLPIGLFHRNSAFLSWRFLNVIPAPVFPDEKYRGAHTSAPPS